MRRALELTRETIVIDTDVVPYDDAILKIAVRDPHEPTTCRSNLRSSVRVIPTRKALECLALGIDVDFQNVYFLEPGPDMPEEYLRGERISVIISKRELK